jgi:large exoprotein involved in heme utilization and adhesion
VELTRTEDGVPVISVESSGAGKAGEITINTPQLTLSDAAKITATATSNSTNLEGGGSVNLNASNIDLAGGTVGVFAATNGQTPAGTLNLQPYQGQATLNVRFTPGSVISATTSSSGRGGDLYLTAPQAITLDGPGTLSVETTGSGDAGNIDVSTQQLTLTNGVQLLASTADSGNAGNISISNTPVVNIMAKSAIRAETKLGSSGKGGNITINAPTAVELARTADGSPIISVESSGAGKAGDIIINTPQLVLSDAAKITATATQSSTNLEGGGSVTLNASNIDLAGGTVGVFAETNGQTPAGTLNLNPYQGQSALNIHFTPGSVISASTSSSGKGGDVILTAPQSITLDGNGKLSVKTSSSGNAGEMIVSTQQLTLKNGIELSASSTGSGQAGNISITADTFNLTQGARVSSTTAKGGKAGNITVNVHDNFILSGQGTGLFANTEKGSTATATGGNINITTDRLTLSNQSQLAVSSQGSGAAGNLTIQAKSLNLDASQLIAETANGQGGDIEVKAADIIQMRRNNLISTTAGSGATQGDGGNITITTPFLLGFASGNSDIVANAFTGSGGLIEINAEGSLNIIPRNRAELAKALGSSDPTKLNPSLLSTNDVTAISQANPNLNGTVNFNAPNLDPGRGLAADPVAPANSQIVQDCRAQTQSSGNKFVNSRRGGTPPDPNGSVTSSMLWQDDRASPTHKAERNQPVTTTISEAQGWKRGPNNTVLFTTVNANRSANLSSTASRPCYEN